MKKQTLVTGAVLVGVTLLGSAALRATETPAPWPTLHRDDQRSGYTDTVVSGPYERKWYRDFHGQMIASRVEAILAEDLCFVGTFSGHLYALDVTDGGTRWCFKAQGPIGHSPCYAQGCLYVGSDDGYLYCLTAATGQERWRFQARAGIWVSPACDGRTVYVGDRAGVFHAVDARTGRPRWSFQTGYMILTPASFSADKQRIVFASEDMHVYCLSPEGICRWRTGKLQGLSLRDHAPTLWQGLALVRTNPADGFHTVMGRNGEMLEAVQRALPVSEEDEVLLDKWGDYILQETPRRRQAEQQAVADYLRGHPADQTFYAFDLETGAEPWLAQVLYTAGLHNPATPPTFNPHTGDLYTFYRSALTQYLRGIRRYAILGRLQRDSGHIDMSWPQAPRHQDWHNFPMIGDETQSLSLMGDILISTHQGELGALHLGTGKQTPIWRGRDTYGGIYGPGALPGGFDEAQRLAQAGTLTGMPNEWHGPDRAIVSIGYRRLFWVVGSQVVCLGGPDTPRTATGGTEPPAPFQSQLPLVQGGNVTRGMSRFDAAIVPPVLDPVEVQRIVGQTPPTEAPAFSSQAGAAALQSLLDRAVMELVSEGPWAPWVVEMGIVREDLYFWRTAETMAILAQALPYVSEPVRAQAKAHLLDMFAQGMPLAQPVHQHAGQKRREMYTYGPGMEAFSRRSIPYQANVEDLFAVWALGHYTGAWDRVLSQLPRIQAIYRTFAQAPRAFDHTDNRTDASEHLNRQIAGVMAYIRLLQAAGAAQAALEPAERLTRMIAERIRHEQADAGLIRDTDPWGHGNVSHNAKIPRYLDLTPELAGLLKRHAEPQFSRQVIGLARQLPLWYQAWQERMIGGENYISPPHLARGLFAALAEGKLMTAQALRAYLDQPWCRADLYYIEKLTILCRNLDGAP